MSDFQTRAQVLGHSEQLKNSESASSQLSLNSLEQAQALSANMLGDSKSVENFESTINAAHFPQQVSAFSAPHLVVKSGSPFIIPGSDRPTVINYETVTIEDGGYIEINGSCSLNVDNLVKTSSTVSKKGYDIGRLNPGSATIHIHGSLQVDGQLIVAANAGHISLIIPQGSSNEIKIMNPSDQGGKVTILVD